MQALGDVDSSCMMDCAEFPGLPESSGQVQLGGSPIMGITPMNLERQSGNKQPSSQAYDQLGSDGRLSKRMRTGHYDDGPLPEWPDKDFQ